VTVNVSTRSFKVDEKPEMKCMKQPFWNYDKLWLHWFKMVIIYNRRKTFIAKQYGYGS